MDHVQAFAVVSVIIVGLTGSLAVISIFTWRAVTRTNATPRLSREANEQLERLQQSVDVIAIEVERIAEAQRFSAKLMAEQPPRKALHD